MNDVPIPQAVADGRAQHDTSPAGRPPRHCRARAKVFCRYGFRPSRKGEGASTSRSPPVEGIWLMNVYVLVELMAGVMAGWGLLTAGASPAEAFGGAVAAAALTDYLLERP